MNEAWEDQLEALEAGRVLRVVNFHNTPAAKREQYARQLEALRERFAPVTEAALDELFDTGSWPGGRPGVIPAFYEGYRDHYDVAAPLLEEAGLVGWFFVPTAFPGTPPAEQVGYARAHRLGIVDGEYADGRHAMTWDEIAELGRRHVVAAHSANHVSAADVVGRDVVEREIVAPYETLAHVLGRPPAAFAWLYGHASGASPEVDDALAATGFRYLFSNTKVQRLPRS